MNDKRTITAKKLQSPIFWLLLVLGVSLLTRLFMIFLYQPVVYSDTPSYRRLADAVSDGFTKYDGTRTPGYPAFLALLGSDQNVWAAQLLIGIATTLLLFYIGWKIADKPWFGGLIALSHTLNLGQLFFESNLITESLTTFLLVITMAGMLIWFIYPMKRSIWLSSFIGLASVFTLLVRPLFIYLPFLMLIFLWIGLRLKYSLPNETADLNKQAGKAKTYVQRHPVLYLIAFLLPVAIFLGGWISFIHARFGDWALTTMTGYHLIQHTGDYFEYVPDEFASIRDTYIEYRDAHIAKYGTQANTIWEAIPEMSRLSGYNFYDLSRVLARISIDLILKHPLLFLKSTLGGWWMFWRTSFYWSAEAFQFPWMATGTQVAITIQRGVLFLINLIFIFVSLYFVIVEFLATIRHKLYPNRLSFFDPAKYAYFWLLLTTIWYASILQTLLDHGDNPRFLVPLQSLLVLWVAWFFFQFFANRKTSRQYTLP